jgi:hypothetical protein
VLCASSGKRLGRNSSRCAPGVDCVELLRMGGIPVLPCSLCLASVFSIVGSWFHSFVLRTWGYKAEQMLIVFSRLRYRYLPLLIAYIHLFG